VLSMLRLSKPVEEPFDAVVLKQLVERAPGVASLVQQAAVNRRGNVRQIAGHRCGKRMNMAREEGDATAASGREGFQVRLYNPVDAAEASIPKDVCYRGCPFF